MSIDQYLPAADRWFTQGDSGEGGFVSSLYDLCGKADTNNQLRLLEAFPSHVGAWLVRNIMGEKVMEPAHRNVAQEWVVRPGDPAVGNWLINRRFKQPPACITHTFFGGTEDVTVEDFVYKVVQDETVGYSTLMTMLDDEDGEHTWEDDQPECHATFTIIDRKEVITQMHVVLPDYEDEDPDEDEPVDDIDDHRGPDGVLGNDAPKD
jgi:hypothetical protein